MTLWRAGEAKKEAEALQSALGVEAAWVAPPIQKGATVRPPGWLSALGMAGRCIGHTGKTLLFGWLALQALSMGVQAQREWASTDSITKMKAEQRWLEGQGLADERRIGVVSTKTFGHLTNDMNKDAFVSAQRSLGGWDVVKGVVVLGGLGARLVGARDPWLEPTAISAPRDGQLISGFDPELKMTYRHEEGHARVRDKQLRAGFPQAWPRQVGELVAEALDATDGRPVREGASPLAMEGAEANWRLAWMSATRSEAFADAYAVLTAARKGKGALAKAAVETHAFRIMSLRQEMVTSTTIAGATHSVEMSSFIAGQLDEGKVAMLGSRGIDELSGKIADDVLAWAVARQAPTLGFFDPDGAAWWAGMARKAGVDEVRAEGAWKQWSKAALAEYPTAAFGEFSYDIEGVKLRALGLDKDLASSSTSAMRWSKPGANGKGSGSENKSEHEVVVKTNWRYDGGGGLVVMRVYSAPSVAQGGVALMVNEDGDVVGGATKILDMEKFRNRWAGAEQGAVSQQMLLAHRLGVDMDEHVALIDKNGGKLMFSGLARLYADSFKSGGAYGAAEKRGASAARKKSTL